MAGRAAVSTLAVSGTDDDPLYQKWRDAVTEYRFVVPAGDYQVVLHFAEFQTTLPLDRLMNITMEGVRVGSNLSIVGLVGKAAALQRSYEVTVSDAILNKVFTKSGGTKSPVVSGVEVLRLQGCGF